MSHPVPQAPLRLQGTVLSQLSHVPPYTPECLEGHLVPPLPMEAL